MTMIKIDQYFEPASWQKFTKAAEGRETPFLVVDLSRIETKYHEMVSLFQTRQIIDEYHAIEVIHFVLDTDRK